MQPLQELVGVERLGEKYNGSPIDGLRPCILGWKSGHHDDRDIGTTAAQFGLQFQAAHFRHMHIRYYAGRVRVPLGEELRGIREATHPKTGGPQKAGEAAPHFAVIVHDGYHHMLVQQNYSGLRRIGGTEAARNQYT